MPAEEGYLGTQVDISGDKRTKTGDHYYRRRKKTLEADRRMRLTALIWLLGQTEYEGKPNKPDVAGLIVCIGYRSGF